ncbi:deoxyguanosinetriphosphate triphosphohydrolase [Tuwongella immobilis]|uniref:Deoxyguanosinetriphosphate triphosphohydrolase-like protein n=1 Tax=Tuwongella immobilis TaxID=692036 RepID=A0A6C2YSH3_9BACT|nr:deoxyguanosinetriphosphate triphosphohydrolase [Tuwongella immobilis]VIP04304.1 deoxyguanosinetriphosphate triphosphohydrolase : Deoxyguanosinetriphosphate triphosphohydrolase-like protein OS=planctomycete KSU-1 GN=KSU1_D0957 PE=3 SV=1: HD: HD_assoc [Tuwongella immobilis]VTS05971.1 deoxyguanosinetriphosphate triphosphohydrolase : Deoxyguanosinetriphosphate triphosphohydrolase-like protein OS=planctomycete KSU-1 GN=KSU1_D0957 PE=3 SV=1: HD: HD_assoc [Tuwongella immobilis]
MMSASPLDWFELEAQTLAPYAMHSRDSRGRQYPEAAHPFRSIYQRDRERIVHSTGFRRLMGKTQVLVAHINDHHRTRLTHTLEVAQIARTIARRLRLNEDLTEAIALAHDLGHPPFGHAGEEALHECLRDHGGFDHNLQGLRQVDEREDRYPEYPGLNLSWELRESFVQHSKRRDRPELAEFWQVGSPLLEAQLVDTVDSLAYDVHDVDDALGIGLISLDDLESVTFWHEAAKPVRLDHPELRGDRFRTAVLRELINWQVSDLLRETESRLVQHGIRHTADVRACPEPLVEFSQPVRELKVELETFLFRRVYKHHRVLRMASKGQMFVKSLFAAYVENPELLPPRHLRRWSGAPLRVQQGVAATAPPAGRPMMRIEPIIGDYLAGMTDRYAQQEYHRLLLPGADL